MSKDKEVIYVQSGKNPNYDHPLNILSERCKATVVTQGGDSATGYGSTEADAVANAASKVR
jgi:hypothetical protein